MNEIQLKRHNYHLKIYAIHSEKFKANQRINYQNNKEYYRQYYINNIEHIKEQRKKYYLKSKITKIQKPKKIEEEEVYQNIIIQNYLQSSLN